MPIPAATADLYEASYFTGASDAGYLDYLSDEVAHRRNAHTRLTVIEMRAATGANDSGRRPLLLDVGCAAGFLLDVARAEGYDVLGVEVSRWARDEARSRFGVPVVNDLEALAQSRPEQFDVACLAQVLEHATHPDTMLIHVARLLREGGILFIETWDRSSWIARILGAHWQQVSPPSVLHLFTATGLREILGACGFVDIQITRGQKRVSLGFIGHLLASKYGAIGRALNGSIRALNVGNLTISYALGDLVVVTALRKREGRREAGEVAFRSGCTT